MTYSTISIYRAAAVDLWQHQLATKVHSLPHPNSLTIKKLVASFQQGKAKLAEKHLHETCVTRCHNPPAVTYSNEIPHRFPGDAGSGSTRSDLGFIITRDYEFVAFLTECESPGNAAAHKDGVVGPAEGIFELNRILGTTVWEVLIRMVFDRFSDQGQADETLKQVVDFSLAQKNAFCKAYAELRCNREKVNATLRPDLIGLFVNYAGTSLLKGCREHYRQSVTRVKRNNASVPLDERCEELCRLLMSENTQFEEFLDFKDGNFRDLNVGSHGGQRLTSPVCAQRR
ncbi:hypothetical protein DFS34DRAFT_396954 [Phlyctochytrium arcticum]|nr:hypothetical protein DFS34DRAFT_396954 [Phlyctochytrium arcticum]